MTDEEQNGGLPSRITGRRAREIKLRHDVVAYYLQGMTAAQIAAKILEETGQKIGDKTVTKLITRATKEWIASKSQMVENHKAIELAKINKLEAEYWTAYYRSCSTSTNTSTEKSRAAVKAAAEEAKKSAGKMAVSKVVEMKKTNLGDARFLDGVQKCIEMRFKLLGLEAMTTPVPQAQQATVVNIQRVTFVTKRAGE